jgi:DNA-binding transcriptional LysR family regulator
MKEPSRKPAPGDPPAGNLTFRQLEVFRMVCRERSYTHAALELRSTRANIKRLCEDFEKAVGRPLFTVDDERNLVPTGFANGLLAHMGPLSHAMRRLADSVRSLHERGRVVRFAAAGEFFRGGLFTRYLARLRINDAFRPCFLRIDIQRFRTALLNAECDVYFGIGLADNDRMDRIDLGPAPWNIGPVGRPALPAPSSPADLAGAKWWIRSAGEPGAALALLESLRAAGASGGGLIDAADPPPAGRGFLLEADTGADDRPPGEADWPCYRFSAFLRKHHPYSDLKSRLEAAAAP